MLVRPSQNSTKLQELDHLIENVWRLLGLELFYKIRLEFGHKCVGKVWYGSDHCDKVIERFFDYLKFRKKNYDFKFFWGCFKLLEKLFYCLCFLIDIEKEDVFLLHTKHTGFNIGFSQSTFLFYHILSFFYFFS